MKKRLLVSAVCVFFAVIHVFAHDYAKYPVYDGADILSETEETLLNEKIRNVTYSHNDKIGIYIVTVDSYTDYETFDIESFAEFWYKNCNLGKGNSHTGLLFVLSMDERDYDICAFGDFAHTSFTDFGKTKLAAAALTHLKSNDWYEAFDSYISKTDTLLVMSENGTPLDVGSLYFDLEVLLMAGGIAVILSLILGLIVALVLRGKMNNVKAAKGARNYVDESSVSISKRSDIFTHTTVVRTPINQNNSGGGGSHGGTSINSGGFSHSSGKF